MNSALADLDEDTVVSMSSDRAKLRGSGGVGLRGTGKTKKGFGRVRRLDKVGTGGGMVKVSKRRPITKRTAIDVDGPASKKHIGDVLKRKRHAFEYCYEKELQRKPKLAGEVTIEFVISKKGRISKAKAAGSTLGDRRVEGCVRRVAKRLRFKKPNGETTVRLTLEFDSKKK